MTRSHAEVNGVATLRDVEAIEAAADRASASSTYELIRRTAERHPEAPALSFFATAEDHRTPRTWSYRALADAITRSANLFHRLGARADTVVALLLPNLPETHFAFWGAEAAGVAMPVNPALEAGAIRALLESARAAILVTLAPEFGPELWQRLRPALEGLSSLRHLVLVRPGDAGASGAAAAPRAGGPSGGGERFAAPLRAHDFGASLAAEVATALSSGRAILPTDPASWFATGGTTGLPKLAMRSHGSEVANAVSLSQALGAALGPGKVMLCGLPLFHVNGLMVTGLLPFATGAQVLLATPQGYRAPGLLNRFWEIVERHRVNFFSGVPTLFASLLQVPVGAHDLSSLDYALCGAAPMPTAVFKSFEERTGLAILEGYGLTEAGCVSSLNPVRGERRVGSIGLRVPGQQMKAVLLDGRGAYVRDCAVGEVGVIAAAGTNVFLGYRDAEQNEGLWIDCGDGRRWLNTGDLGRVDAEGYFWLTGRRKELIIRGGHNIDPAAIEDVLHRHPAVALAAAVGRPDAYAGELPVAYVQLKRGADVSAAELLDYLRREVLEQAALPRHIRLVAEMPVTGVGKIYKPELKRREAKDALEAALREAGVVVRSVEIGQQAGRGMVAEVECDGEASAKVARVVLGRFALPVTVR